MSGLGEAASIAAIISIAGQAVQASSALYTFIKTYKAVGPKLLEIAEEVKRLQKTLSAIGPIASRAEASPGIAECCSRLQDRLATCQINIEKWGNRLALDLKGSSRAGKVFMKIKIAANRDFLGELRFQITQSREELILELSIFQSTLACLAVQSSQATLSGLETLRDHQESSFLALNQRGIETHGNLLQAPDLLGIERRLEVLSQSLQRAVEHDHSSSSQLSNQMLSKALDRRLDRESDKLAQQAGKKLQLNMTLRLVQPAILAYDRKGKLGRVLVSLEIRELTAFCLDERLAVLQYILNIRLLLWLIPRIQIRTFSFASYSGRSLLSREAQLASIWNFAFFRSGIRRRYTSLAGHCFLNFTLLERSPNMGCLLDRVDEELRRQLHLLFAHAVDTWGWQPPSISYFGVSIDAAHDYCEPWESCKIVRGITNESIMGGS